ncbi:hypothetical protein AB0L75_00020 [Streptomyces sp. NPDC052101]|uniref:hypothetical protein n=1 Tax=Streptomyces sp. NPDC052101 TaxID=3155763 RepID=UPI003448B7E4
MTSSESPSLFDAVARSLAAPGADGRLCLTVPVGDRTSHLSPQQARAALYGSRADRTLWTAIWRQAVVEAQRSKDGDGGYRLLAVWLALPGLYRSWHRIRRQLPVERADLEAEIALAVLEALDAADPCHPDPGGRILGHAANRMWAAVSSRRHEVPVADVAAAAAARYPGAGPEADPGGHWDLHITPPPRCDGLSATLRFVDAGTRREGERLGALAHSAGLAHLVFRARRHAEAYRIGTLALLPSGSRP